jgi:hypothetical protein
MNENLSYEKTGAMHTAVRKVLKHHKLTEVGDGVVEADLIYAVLECLAKDAGKASKGGSA